MFGGIKGGGQFTQENVEFFLPRTDNSPAVSSLTACLSSRIGNVRVVSTNFHLTLQWDAAETTVAGRRPLYTVVYKT